MLERELRKGTTPLLILALLEAQPRHGYELSKVMDAQSHGVLRLHPATLYPLLYSMEKSGWIVGRWVEKAGQRRRRFYQLTAAGRAALEQQRTGWLAFAEAVGRVAGVSYA